MRTVIGVLPGIALAAIAFPLSAKAQDWLGHVTHSGRIVVEAAPPPYPPPYPFPHVDFYPGSRQEAYYATRPPMPPTPDEQARRYPSWFYCDSAAAYFPYVKSCEAGFRPVPMAPPPRDAAPPPAVAASGLAHCASPEGFYPYVKACNEDWTAETSARPPGAPNGPAARWSWCEAAKAFQPYVDACAAGWKEIAAAPQPIAPRAAQAAR
jgi:hypothetical protein